MKNKILFPALIPLFLLSLLGCQKDKKIKALGEEILKYVDFNISYRIKESYKMNSLYVTVEAKAKAGYVIDDIVCTIRCGITYSFDDYTGESDSCYTSKDLHIYIPNKTFEEYVQGKTSIYNVDVYFERITYGRDGTACDLTVL